MKYLNNISFKVKTIIGIAIIESILLALIYFTSINALSETSENQIKARGHETSNLIALWVKNGLLTYDVGNTESFITTLSEGESLVYVHVKDSEGNTFAFAGDNAYRDKPITVDQTLADASVDGVFDTRSNVDVDGISIGIVEIGLSVQELSKYVDEVALKIKVIAVAEVFLSALFSWLLGWLLTQRLENLKELALDIEKGEGTTLTPDSSKDEIGVVSQAFCSMAVTLFDKERKLSSTKLKLERVFNSTPEGVLVLLNDGTVGAVNPAFHKIINCSEDLDIGDIHFKDVMEKLATRIDENDFSSVKWLKKACSFDGLDEMQSPEIIQFAKPNYRVLEVKQQIINDMQSGIKSILYFIDLTKSQEIERLKSSFLAHAAHELRTPMTSVMGFSELLKAEGIDDQQRIELASIINNESNRLVEMVNELLDISSIESGGAQALNLELVNMKEIVDKAWIHFSVPEGRRIFIKDYCDEDTLIRADKDKLYQVIINLISNAYKYSNANDQVSVYVGSASNQAHQAVVELKVTDTGIGMNKDQTEKIFDRFWRADESGKVPGAGLGMSLVKEIVTLMNGEVSLQSELGKGTTVTIQFPV